jgi:hypothetical protein
MAEVATHRDGLLSCLTKASHRRWELSAFLVQLLMGIKLRGASMERSGFSNRAEGEHAKETSGRVER